MITSSHMDNLQLERLFPGDSELTRLMRALDWSKTDLGAPEKWPATWRMAVSLCLTSRIPIVLYLGPHFTVLYNDPYISFLGETKHPRYLGQPGRECWREIWETIGPMLNSVYQTGQATWSEDVLMFFARKRPLEEVYVRFTFGPILAADGRSVDGIFCPCTETTEQVVGARRLETLRKLGIQAAEARNVEAACANAASVLDENRQDIPFAAIYVVNEAGQAILSASAGIPAQGHPLPLSVSATGDDHSPWPLASVLQTQRTVIIDLGLLGSQLPGGLWSEPLDQAVVLPISAAAHESLAGLLIVGVTPRRVLDDAYRTFFDLIAGHIGTAITDAQAYEAERKRAEVLAELDRAKTAFFSNVSHELRTPLTLMLGPLEDTLATPDLPSNKREQLHMVHRNGLRLLKLVNTLLDFSRIEAGRVEAVYEPTDLAAYTAELASVFRSAIERAGLQLVVDSRPLPEPVYMDREMWEKIVLNLLSNAFKFTFQGRIVVALRKVDHQVQLEVRDTGVGIEPEQLPHIFERFHRVPGVQARTHEGTGIGLALVHELVKLHGGTVRVTSEVNQGTSFTVSLPMGSSHLPTRQIGASRTLASTALGSALYVEEATRWQPSEESAELYVPSSDFDSQLLSTQDSALSADSSRPLIVLADDNADMRAYVRRLLSQRYEVAAVPDGKAALAVIRKRVPDLVLSDVMMPHLDGFGLIRELRADPATKTIPIILLSARAGEESRVEGLEHGADDYLIKPFSARELMARVSGHLEMARIRREAQSEIARSKRFLERIAAATPDMLFVHDLLEGRNVYINRSLESVLGYTVETLQALPGDLTNAVVHPDDLAGIRQWFARFDTVGEGEVIEHEHRVRHKDGSYRWILARATVFERTAEGRVKRIIGVAIDITERKRTEQALRKWEYIFNHAGWAVAAVDPKDNTLMMANPAFAQMHGYAVEELLGRPVTDTFAPESRAELPQHVAAAHAQGDYVYESLHIRKDGSIFPVLTHVTAFKDEAGRVLYRAATFQDITDRKQAEDSKFKLAAIVESSDDAIISKDFDGTILSWNKGAERIFGYTAAETVGQNISLLFPPDRLDEEKEIIAKIKCGERIAHYETVRRRKDGTEIPISLTVSPVTNAAGKVIGASKIARDITERKQAEEALQESETRTRTILDTALDAVITIDRDGRIIGWNPQAEVIFGYAVGEVSGRLLSDTIIPPRDREAHTRGLRRFLETGAGPILNRRIEVSALHKDGHEFQVELTVSPMQLGGQQVFSAFIRDITERKRAELALREREEILRLLIEHTPASVAMFDREMRYLAVSKRFLSDLKIQDENIIGRSHYDIFPEITERWKEVHRRCLAGAVERAEDDPFMRCDGTIDWIRWEIRPWYHNTGEIGGIVLFSEVITERKQAQAAMQQSELRYRSLVSVLTSVAWVTDSQGRFIEPQSSWEAYTGQIWKEHKDFGWAMALHPEDRERVKAIWENALTGSYYESEGRIWHAASGQYRYFNARAVPLRDAKGAVREWIGTVTDIHDRRLAEEEVRRLNRTLEQKVAERTAALEESNQALESFTYSVSHDLRAPLRSMQGFAQALREDYANRLDAVAQDYVIRIVNGARRMDGLILDLLAYSRLNRTEIASSPVDLWAVVKDTRIQLDTMLSDAGARVTVADYLPPVIAHAPTLTQILVNLLSNAAKFVAPGVRPNIHILTEERGRTVRLWIEDNGIGIAAEHHDRIFRVFERLHGIETYPGTGIGLAIVQKGIERMSGRAGVESKLGAGSRFWIELPAVGRTDDPV